MTRTRPPTTKAWNGNSGIPPPPDELEVLDAWLVEEAEVPPVLDVPLVLLVLLVTEYDAKSISTVSVLKWTKNVM